MKPKKIDRVVFKFADGAEKILEAEELQAWVAQQLNRKPILLPFDETRQFNHTRFMKVRA